MLFNTWRLDFVSILDNISVTDRAGADIGIDRGCSALLEKTHQSLHSQARIFFIGNGASAAMASHIAADMGKNSHLKTRVFTDFVLLTAIANDFGGENIFMAPLRNQAEAGDVLVAISSSGNSINLIRAVEVARDMGLSVLTFTAMDSSNRLRAMGDINFWVPAASYGHAESAHAALLHYWVDNVLDSFKL